MKAIPVTHKAQSSTSPLKNNGLVEGAARAYGTSTRKGPDVTTTTSTNKRYADLRNEGWTEDEIKEAKAWRDKNKDAPRDQVITETTTSGPDIITDYSNTYMKKSEGNVRDVYDTRREGRKIKEAEGNVRRDKIKSAKMETRGWTVGEDGEATLDKSKVLKGEKKRVFMKDARNKAKAEERAAELAGSQSKSKNVSMEVASGKDTGSTYRQPDVVRTLADGTLAEQDAQFKAEAEAKAREAAKYATTDSNPYGFNASENKGANIGTAKIGRFSSDAGVANSIPEPRRLATGTNPLEDAQAGIRARVNFPTGAAQGNEGELFNKNTPAKMSGTPLQKRPSAFNMSGYGSKTT